MNTITQMAHKYRKLCKQVQQADAKILKVKQQAQQLNQIRNQIIQEMEHLRVLLDHCVVTGESPVQAQLSHTHTQMHVKVSEHRRQFRMDDYYFTSSGSTVTLGTLGPTLSTISMGPTITATPSHIHTITAPASTNYTMLDEIDLSNS
jgi:hypothetical protein